MRVKGKNRRLRQLAVVGSINRGHEDVKEKHRSRLNGACEEIFRSCELGQARSGG